MRKFNSIEMHIDAENVSSKKIDNFDIKSVDIQLVGRKVCNNL